jgi:hypothetical protein
MSPTGGRVEDTSVRYGKVVVHVVLVVASGRHFHTSQTGHDQCCGSGSAWIRIILVILGKLYQDLHQSGNRDPDPHQSEKHDPNPHQSEKVEDLEGHFEAL